MSKFIVIPEPHISSTNIEGRQDYLTEIKVYMSQVMDFIKFDEEIRWAVFVGDIFNRGFIEITEYLYWSDWFIELDSLLSDRYGCIYSAVGNHELSFSKNNPFWRFISNKDGGFNTAAVWRTKAVNPMGAKSLIHVEDYLKLGDKVGLYLCHYDAVSTCSELLSRNVDDEIKVCISHLSIISSEITRVLRDNYGRDPLTHVIEHEQIRDMDFLHNFDYVFNGHMHKAYSRFTITNDATGHKTRLMYLGSLGRTNSEEINDTDLIRTLPIIDVDTGEMTCEEIVLWNRKSAIVQDYDFQKSEKKIEKEKYTEICSKLENIDSPVNEIMNTLSDRNMAILLEKAVIGIKPDYMEDLLDRCREMRYAGT